MLPFVLITIVVALDKLFFSYKKKNVTPKLLTALFLTSLLSLLPLLIYIKISTFKAPVWSYTLSLISITLVCLYIRLRNVRLFLIPALLVSLSIEVYNTYNYSLKNMSKNYKKTLYGLKEYNNNSFIGGWSLGFRVGNDIDTNPSLNQYLYYGEGKTFWNEVDSIAKANNSVDYSIGYDRDSIKYKKIGFQPYRVIMKADETVSYYDLILYKESQANETRY